MSFTYPTVLFLLVLPALLLFWIWRREAGALVLPFDHGRQRRGLVLRGLVGVFESLPALVLALVIVIIAGPQQLSEPKTKRRLTNIEFCVDVSGSMGATFGDGTRYDASMAAIEEFLDYRKGDAFGLTFFGNAVLHWVPLTNDTSAIRCAPPFMRPGQLPYWFGGTSIGLALLECRKVLNSREEGDRMIVLVSDGFSSDLGNDRDVEIARELAADGIVVYSIHIAETEIPPPIVNITALTHGAVFQPGDMAGLSAIFKRIDEMQVTELEKTSAETMDWFGPFAWTALGLVGAGLLALYGLRYTPW